MMTNRSSVCRSVSAALLSAALLFGCAGAEQRPSSRILGGPPQGSTIADKGHDAPATKGDEFVWYSFNDEAILAAAQSADATGKLLLLYFMDESCQWCTKLDEEVFADAAARGFIAKHFVSIRVDVARSTLDEEIGLLAVPTLVAASATEPYGSEHIAVMVGYHGAERTVSWLLSNAKLAPNWASKQER